MLASRAAIMLTQFSRLFRTKADCSKLKNWLELSQSLTNGHTAIINICNEHMTCLKHDLLSHLKFTFKWQEIMRHLGDTGGEGLLKHTKELSIFSSLFITSSWYVAQGCPSHPLTLHLHAPVDAAKHLIKQKKARYHQ